MNNLSMLIYIANVCESLNSALTGFFAVFMMLTGALSIITVLAFIEDEPEVAEQTKKWAIKSGIVLGIVAAIGTFVPNKNTVMMIAASEYAEKFVKSEQAQQVIDPSIKLLHAWIEKQMIDLAKK
jgi:hypothetical protein